MANTQGYNGELRLDASPGGSLTDYSAKVVSMDSNIPVELLDTTAFGKTQRTRITGLKDFEFSATFLSDADGTISAIIAGHLQASQTISFQIGPEGTATGALKLTGECHLESMSMPTEVDGVVQFTASYKGSDTTTIGTQSCEEPSRCLPGYP